MAKTTTAQTLLDWIEALPDRASQKIMSGQQILGEPSSEANVHLKYTESIADLFSDVLNYPAILGFEYGYDSTSATRTLQNRYAIDHARIGGIVQMHFPQTNPWTGGSSHDLTDRDLETLLNPVTAPEIAANTAWLVTLDDTATSLQELADEDIPVLWRPYHEMTFAANSWWDAGAHAGDPDPFIAMWQYVHDYFTVTKGLNNLIWVFATANNWYNYPGIDFYPGTDYVDIVGADVYHDQTLVKGNEYDDLLATGKPFAITEHGPGTILDGSYDNTDMLDVIKADYEDSVYFLRWSSWPSNEVAIVDCTNAQALMDDSWVVNIHDLDWKEFGQPISASDSDILARWRFENDALDETANNNDLTPVNTPTYTAVSPLEGTYSADLERSSTQYYNLGSPSFNITGPFSLMAWIKPEGVTTSMAIVAFYNTSSNRAYILWINGASDDTVRFNVSGNGTDFSSAYGLVALAAGEEYHITAVYDGVDLRVYVNGILASSEFNPLTYSSGVYGATANWRLGYHSEGTWPYDGLLDDVMVIDRALNAGEAFDYYENGLLESSIMVKSFQYSLRRR